MFMYFKLSITICKLQILCLHTRGRNLSIRRLAVQHRKGRRTWVVSRFWGAVFSQWVRNEWTPRAARARGSGVIMPHNVSRYTLKKILSRSWLVSSLHFRNVFRLSTTGIEIVLWVTCCSSLRDQCPFLLRNQVKIMRFQRVETGKK